MQHPREAFLAGAGSPVPAPAQGPGAVEASVLAGDAHVHDDVVRRLAAACRTGEVIAIETVLDPAAAAVCDGGGRVPALIGSVHGAAEVARLLCALLPGTDLTIESVNGRAGLAIRRAGTAVAVIAVSCDEERATTLCVVLNPAKLRGWHRR